MGRLRHIVVRHRECKFPVDPLKNKAATRTPMEAETLLRETLAELLKDGNHRGDSKWAAQSTPRIMKAIQDVSECKSARKGLPTPSEPLALASGATCCTLSRAHTSSCVLPEGHRAQVLVGWPFKRGNQFHSGTMRLT